MKVFISFSTDDRDTAVSLYGDLSAAGAEVFRYGESETVGTPTWPEILEWINKSDVFILLVSKSALNSSAVREEVDHAHYRYINSNRTHPSKLIPAIVEKGIGPPTVMERFSQVDLLDYENGNKKLFKQLGLSSKVAAKRKLAYKPPPGLFAPTIDIDKLLANTRKKSTPPAERIQWNKDAVTMLSNYSMLKPATTSKKEEAAHIDKLLADYSKKDPKPRPAAKKFRYLDSAFLRLPEVAKPADKESDKAVPDLSKLLLNYNHSLRLRPLETPVLQELEPRMGTLSWSAVGGAVAYVVEESASANFIAPMEVYRDVGTRFATRGVFAGSTSNFRRIGAIGATRYYRVKAAGGVFRVDSVWSNTIAIAPLTANTALPAPTLTAIKTTGGALLTWTKTPGAMGYVLERSRSSSFAFPVKIYEGKEIRYTDNTLRSGFGSSRIAPKNKPARPRSFALELPGGVTGTGAIGHYRVKARGGFLTKDSPWSTVATVGP